MLGRHDVPLDVELGGERVIAAQTCELGRRHVPVAVELGAEQDITAQTCEWGRPHDPLAVEPDCGRGTVAEPGELPSWPTRCVRHHVPLDVESDGERDIAAQTCEEERPDVPLVAGPDGEWDRSASGCRHVPEGVESDGERDTSAGKCRWGPLSCPARRGTGR